MRATDGPDFAVPAGGHATVGEISIINGEPQRARRVYAARDNGASRVSFIEQRDLVQA